ncbi:cytochrome C oxidase copper chaperone (COX17) domain-containing protein [Purpureocillium lilacinum]|uniref:Cytochrome C oxidase copper chaperone (COX17) domain-containing protein n=1 Tax=Purpureocillium lilacinum TaxID=33203 RepID=A0A179H3V7_PURLI|nr:cytochrome C oxidase copper chaperone (COX17) domain-containing protein [Purpureocillium lilacinum]OAQ84039.1 cytochrome C oxidase copper chaperone (COX17) domain-containing protein [Purpureocillium lilacinum]OAQ90826.1 cytochrome C oxidase copper chaperone (COX17) domain-containing protein [Purpureocillium lilacinum]GJN68364.1 cytochrome c oxidase copper chaperone [Purpureocillium lilacinum]GJN77961.1 cytochrome c oxidase copper chaperone [Purpureocillium lilacinum]
MDAKTATLPTAQAAAPAAAATDASASKPKPCCVCKDEKSRRDECMLFSTAKDPAADCKSLVDQYKTCMLGYGFKV